MRQLILLMALAGCAVAPAPVAFRDPAAPIYSAALLDASRLPGEWRQAAELAQPGAPMCSGGGVRIAADGGISGRLCLNGRAVPVAGVLRPAGPGRLEGTNLAPWWVIWVDEGYRTLAVATPSGGFGFVLDRSGALPPDRFDAAAEIFDFNGHDRTRLRRLP